MTKENKSINMGWLKETEIAIRNGSITMAEASKHMEFDTIFGKVVESHHWHTLRNYFRKNNIHIFSRGRKDFHHINTEIIQEVVETHEELKIGITKTWERLNKEGTDCSREEVADIFSAHIRGEVITIKKSPKQRCRYLVDKVYGVWHGDIHYLILNHQKRYLFALIDDRSRYIVGYGIFNFKTSDNCISVFQKAIADVSAKPLVYWSDNGLENKSEKMARFCETNSIHQIFTLPGNPQSNGKIEKFWRPLSARIEDAQTWEEMISLIDKYIVDYNTKIPHSALEKGKGGKTSYPCEVYFNESIQASDIDSTFIHIDDKGCIPLSDFLHLKSSVAPQHSNPDQNPFSIESLLV